ncbi:uncharacterized protein LOC128953618 [Oppia nitens]|uniref:uncharacterized protein LOC128953618 n=1 Tax=Oppia nitens TaxID=1686743 RepID=UPI0023DB3823|nr:uncharacterized protein LOC128953618 [Oppia nitens]
MHNSLKFYIFITLIIVNVINSNAAPNNANDANCNNKVRAKIDRQVSQITPILNGNKLPETVKQLNKYCTISQLTLNSVASYMKSCMGTLGPIMAKEMLQSSKKSYKRVCINSANEENVAEFLSTSKCLNSAANHMDSCVQNIFDVMTVLPRIEEMDRMNLGCCHISKFIGCAKKSMINTKQCNGLHKQLINQINNSLSFVCNDYYLSNNTKCAKLMAQTPKLDNTYVRPKSPFSAAMEILDSYRSMKCTKKANERLDKLVQRLFTLGTPDLIPENGAQLKQWCNTAISNIPFVYGYVESCLSDFGKFLVKMMASLGINNFEPYCSPKGYDNMNRPNAQMQQYIKAAKCGNLAEDKLIDCTNSFIDGVMGIVEAPDNFRIKMSCCNAYKYRTCIFNATNKTNGCDTETVVWAESQVMQNLKPAIDMMCAEHWSSTGKCAKLLIEIPKMDSKTYERPKSVFMPIMKLFDSFPDVELN